VDLQKHPSYGSGLIVLERYQFLRDDASMDFQVSGLRFPLLLENHRQATAGVSHPLSHLLSMEPVF